jgi:hypothetical protein
VKADRREMFQICGESVHTAVSKMPRLALRLNKIPTQIKPENIVLVAKKPEREANHSAPFSTETKKKWSHKFALFICRSGVHWNHFTFCFKSIQ